MAGALARRTSLGKAAAGGGGTSGQQRCERSGGADGATPAVSGLLSGNTSQGDFAGGGGVGDGRRSGGGAMATGGAGTDTRPPSCAAPQSLCNFSSSGAVGCETGGARERNSQLLDVLAVRSTGGTPAFSPSTCCFGLRLPASGSLVHAILTVC